LNSWWLYLLGFVSTIVFIVALRPVSFALGLIDKPASRKQHEGAVPLIGGVAIYLAMLLTFGIEAFFGGFGGASGVVLGAFLIASLVLVVTGALDDRFGLSPQLRILLEVVAALVMIYGSGVVLRDLGELLPSGSIVYLGIFAVPFTVLVTVGAINAMNMCDGLDGLSGNLALVMLVGIGMANFLWGDIYHLQILINVLSACIIGFLTFNQRVFWRSKAWVFLGDAGSMMLGLALVWSVIDITQARPRVLTPAMGLWFLALPVFDTVTIMLRRLLKGRSPFSADAEHLHHLLVRSGSTVSIAIMIMCALAAVGCMVGLMFRYYEVRDIVVAQTFFLTGLLYLGFVSRAWSTRRLFGRKVV
jgi:UDP-GlcNAc:undecaprenyl-phosphate/decaprenyl-phosphate GlcNAc-1-phosphate transferase